MTPLTRYSLYVSLTAFALIFLAGGGIQLAITRGLLRSTPSIDVARKSLVLFLFYLFAMGLFPGMISLFTRLQGDIGNSQLSPIRLLRDHHTAATLVLWSFMTLGLLIALPTMAHDLLGIGVPAAGPPSAGVLRADINMSLDEIARASTIPVPPLAAVPGIPSTRAAGQLLFDFEFPTGHVTLGRCRSYWIDTGGPKNDPHLNSILLTVTESPLPRLDFDKHKDAIRSKLISDGFQPAGGGDRRYAKFNTLVTLEDVRSDVTLGNDNPATAGLWVLSLHIEPLDPSLKHPFASSRAATAR